MISDADNARIAKRIARLFPSRWLRGYAGGKLRTDPVYRASAERLCGSALPLLDLGCGLGLHGFYLRERGFEAPILGFDVDKRKIVAGAAAAQRGGYGDVLLRAGDALTAMPEHSGHVSMLDVLHYFPAPAQAAVLDAMAARVAPGGWCFVRATLRDGSLRYRLTQVEERFARLIAWMSRPAISFPTREEIVARFPETEWEHDVRPLWGRTPFNSWLLAFHRRR